MGSPPASPLGIPRRSDLPVLRNLYRLFCPVKVQWQIYTRRSTLRKSLGGVAFMLHLPLLGRVQAPSILNGGPDRARPPTEGACAAVPRPVPESLARAQPGPR